MYIVTEAQKVVLNILYHGLVELPTPKDYSQSVWHTCLIGQAAKRHIAGFYFGEDQSICHAFVKSTRHYFGSDITAMAVSYGITLHVFGGGSFDTWKEAMAGFKTYMDENKLWIYPT